MAKSNCQNSADFIASSDQGKTSGTPVAESHSPIPAAMAKVTAGPASAIRNSCFGSSASRFQPCHSSDRQQDDVRGPDSEPPSHQDVAELVQAARTGKGPEVADDCQTGLGAVRGAHAEVEVAQKQHEGEVHLHVRPEDAHKAKRP